MSEVDHSGAASGLRLARAALDVVVAHAAREAPDECCGLLIGVGDRVDAAWAAANDAASTRVRYLVSPADHFAAIRAARERQGAVVGAYHSHPASEPRPSPTDVAEAVGDFWYLIVGRTAGGTWRARAFRLLGGNFEERTLVVES